MNKLIYKTGDGEVIAIGAFKDVVVHDGQAVVNVDFDIPSEPLYYFTFDGTNLIRKPQSVIDKISSEINFKPALFAGTLSMMFSIDEVVELRSSFGILQGYAEFHTSEAFGKMKQYLDKLELDGDLTANQKARIYTACQNQGINLNNY